MTSRKHYVAVAKLIADEAERVNPAVEPTRALSIENIARGLADEFKCDNPRFDRGRFYFAAALDDNGRIDPETRP